MVDATVTGVDRGEIKMDRNYVLEADTIATEADPNPTLEREQAPVYNLVIDHPEATILWDSGSHHEAADGHWPDWMYNAFTHVDPGDHRLDDDLDDAGYDIADIDAVVQTHLHMDHAGGLKFFDGTDVPIYVHEEEFKYAYYSANLREGSAGYVLDDFHHDLNWEIVHDERETHFEDLEFVHLPGHTPGLLGVKLDLDGGETVVLTSDQCDVLANYEYERPMGNGTIWNQQAWLDSIHTLQELERTEDAELIFGHDHEQIDRIMDGWGH